MFSKRLTARALFGRGIFIGVAGGLAEVVVVYVYTALTGGDAAVVGRGVAEAVGLPDASAWVGLAVHMGLAASLGTGLYALFSMMHGSSGLRRSTRFMLGSLTAVWAFNFFVLLPVLSPGFVHVLPYAVTLASKLAFGLAAAGMTQFHLPAGRFWSLQVAHRTCLATVGE